MEDSVVLDEYGKKVPGCFRPCKPHCPYTAVIPSITIDTKDGLRDIADCLVHVTSVNTTYYIDDKHRIMTVWAGPVEVDDYDYEENPLGLRSQYVIDRESGRMVYYNAVGDYSVMPLVEPEEQVDKTYVDEKDAEVLAEAKAYTDAHSGGSSVSTYIDLTITGYTPTASGFAITASPSISLEEATELWESGVNIKYRINLEQSPDPSTVATGVYEISPLYIGPQFGVASYTDVYNDLNMSIWHEAGVPEVVTINTYSVFSALNLATVATTGSYNDLSDKPTIPNITVQASDPGEGTALAANNFIAVYLEGGE